MHVMKVRNVEEALSKGLLLLGKKGEVRDSRAGPCIVHPGPVTTQTTEPTERVLLWGKRDANPFFHLHEALWMLAGRNDVLSVAEYVRRMREFSDDGSTFNAAYGHRWRGHFGRDQVQDTIAQLKANPDDRRVVIGMWDPSRDLGLASKDLPCLAGDTIVWSPEGDLPIQELAQRFATGQLNRWPIYAVCPEKKRVELQWASNFWSSGFKRTLKIKFDDGSSIRLTPDHTLYLRRGKAIDARPVAAGSLKVGDRVLATHRRTSPKGHEQFKRELGLNARFSNLVFTHREYAELLHGEIPVDFVVHHENEDKRDNRSENLKVISASEHNRLHRMGDLNPMRRMSSGQHRKRAEKHSASLRANWASLSEEERSLRSRGLLKDNHRVVSIEEGELEEVYDFTVGGFHTALVGTGVVAHNCNTHIYLSLAGRRRGRRALDMTVCCRSNDAIWGAHGANAVHFSVLQEYIASAVGVPVGTMWQLSNNYHAYQEVFEGLSDQQGFVGLPEGSAYERGEVAVMPLVEDLSRFDYELEVYFQGCDGLRALTQVDFWEPFFFRVVIPMRMSWLLHRKKEHTDALAWAEEIKATDWRRACVEWLKRREK